MQSRIVKLEVYGSYRANEQKMIGGNIYFA